MMWPCLSRTVASRLTTLTSVVKVGSASCARARRAEAVERRKLRRLAVKTERIITLLQNTRAAQWAVSFRRRVPHRMLDDHEPRRFQLQHVQSGRILTFFSVRRIEEDEIGV